MILNANIPLNNQHPIRQHRWRIGLFLGLILVGIVCGWGITKKIFSGIITPHIKMPSGVSIRITPENALWFAQHTNGLAISSECPIDLPTLFATKTPTWTIVGESGGTTMFVLTGALPNELKNYTKAFACNMLPIKNGYVIKNSSQEIPEIGSMPHLTTPDGWAWSQTETFPIHLHEHGVNIEVAQTKTSAPMPWPEEQLTTALPLNTSTATGLPQSWQGLTDLFTSQKGIAFFTWKNNEKNAVALTIQETLTDEAILSLVYDLGEIPTNAEKKVRKDNTPYVTTAREEIVLVWENEIQGEVQLKQKTIIAYVVKKDGQTLISTAPTTWNMALPKWQTIIPKENNPIMHHAKTLEHFGEKIFIAKKKITIFQE